MKILVLVLTLMLSGCSTMDLVGGLFSDDGGTDVNTNAQIGKENTQNNAVVQANTEASGEAQVADQANKVEGTQIINSELPPWVLILIALLATSTDSTSPIAEIFFPYTEIKHPVRSSMVFLHFPFAPITLPFSLG